MIRERNDWCISRQRRWGLPIPVFYCADCGKPIVTDETIEAVSKLFGRRGPNAWYEMEARDILPQGFTCPNVGRTAALPRRGGTPWTAGSTPAPPILPPCRRTQGFWPATMHMEGLDPVPRLVPVQPAHRRGRAGKGAPLPGVRHPRMDRGRRGQGHAQVPGQRRGPRGRSSRSTARI